MKVLFVDDNDTLFEGLSKKLKALDSSTSVEFSQTIKSAEDKLWTEKFDLVILDIEFDNEANRTGATLAKRIKKDYPLTPVLAYSHNSKYRSVMWALENGFDSFLPKHHSSEDFEITIRGVMKTQPFESPHLKKIQKDKKEKIRNNYNYGLERLLELSDRELQVVFLRRDQTRKEIANKLGIVYRTVGNHLEKISSKLFLKSSLDVVVFSQEYHVEIGKLLLEKDLMRFENTSSQSS